MNNHDAPAANAPSPAHTNRLIHETSPYLLQHAHNPVDWYPWGAEALEAARTQDKPILLSIGYAACHWCHVMAHESFENEDTARLMNELFISIKVDREERPDLDALYMDAVQALTGSGGWPMTVFLTPDGAPFFGGTYFPPVSRYGMPGFPQLLRSIANLYHNRRNDVERQAEEFRQFYQRRGDARVEPLQTLQGGAFPREEDLTRAAALLLSGIDPVEGGFGRAPKFPQPMTLEFLLRVASRTGTGDADGDLIRLTQLTLNKMAEGGMYDQVGGGFHRYSTDATWLVPHFEKMLYDNAQLAILYLHAWQFFGDDRYRAICEQTLDYIQREMTDPAGGFYSTQDADSDGEEGKFYVWTPQELAATLGEWDAAIVSTLWGVSPGGNFEGKNILHVAGPPESVAARYGLSVPDLSAIIADARRKLYEARSRRVWPGRDDKVLTGWNGLTLRAFAEAARALDRDDYSQTAVANAAFITSEMRRDGRLLRSWRGGVAKIAGYLEDYAALANGLISLYETTGVEDYYHVGYALCVEMTGRFWDQQKGTFFDTSADHESLIGRPREITDNATPSGMSLAVEALLRLWALSGEAKFYDIAAHVLTSLAPAACEQPSAFGRLLCVLDDYIGPYSEIAIVGAPDDERTQRLLQVVFSHFLPRAVVAVGSPGQQDTGANAPLLAGREPVDGAPTAYICRRFVCKQPITDPHELRASLGVRVEDNT